ncbi:signal-transducing adaptor protein 2-like isoform X2 [Nerophis ophidion]|uniref:signal-transducing adaptor protein 2-like isoform X2 n=1 Tax=Nerophis ophidion TaxID=159077 RepID=UPI002ADF6A16|nr:signal-transducing adaptor protein 2-like isoform X2 [Nerophis ophidion]
MCQRIAAHLLCGVATSWMHTTSLAGVQLIWRSFTMNNLQVRNMRKLPHYYYEGYVEKRSFKNELSVSSSLNLLPGQMLRLKEVVEKEMKRLKHVPVPVDPVVEMPNCFHPVSRLEAELLLEQEASKGNLLLRPNSDGRAFAISTREELNGPIYKHYRVIRKHDASFTIGVKHPVTCASLPDIFTYFMDIDTEGSLTPLSREEIYPQNISYVDSDNESGERLLRRSSAGILKPNFSTKPGGTRWDRQWISHLQRSLKSPTGGVPARWPWMRCWLS